MIIYDESVQNMWNYIEKINWDKEIAQIPFFKNKQLHINIEYQGYAWECGFEWQKDTSFMSRGWWLKFTLFGILFKIYFSDKRWYNEKEGRFYLDDEPRWTEFWDPSYLKRVQTFMQKHPEIKEEYYGRCVEEMKKNQWETRDLKVPSDKDIQEREKIEERQELEQIQQASKVMEKMKKPIDLDSVRKAIKANSKDFISRICEFSFQRDSVFFRFGYNHSVGAVKHRGKGYLIIRSFQDSPCFSVWDSGYVQDILPYYDLYDKKGNLLSRAVDYSDLEPIKWAKEFKDSCEMSHPKDQKQEDIKYETINKSRVMHFNNLINACGGPQGMIDKGIPWEKVAWARTFWHGGEDFYFPIFSQKEVNGNLHMFTKDDSRYIERTKQDLAHSCDLYDKDGKLLNIMFLRCSNLQ